MLHKVSISNILPRTVVLCKLGVGGAGQGGLLTSILVMEALHCCMYAKDDAARLLRRITRLASDSQKLSSDRFDFTP